MNERHIDLESVEVERSEWEEEKERFEGAISGLIFD